MNTQLTRIETTMKNNYEDDDTPIIELENDIYGATYQQVHKWVNRILEGNESSDNIKQYVKDTYEDYAYYHGSHVLDMVNDACELHRKQQTQ